jgi:hypothetical protein
MHEIVRKIIPIQAAGSAGGFRRGGVDTIRAERARRAASFAERAGSPSLFIDLVWLQRVTVNEQAAAEGGLAIRGSFSICPLLPSTASRFMASTGLPARRTYGVSWAFARRVGAKKCAKIANFCRAILGYR